MSTFFTLTGYIVHIYAVCGLYSLTHGVRIAVCEVKYAGAVSGVNGRCGKIAYLGAFPGGHIIHPEGVRIVVLHSHPGLLGAFAAIAGKAVFKVIQPCAIILPDKGLGPEIIGDLCAFPRGHVIKSELCRCAARC